jgi:hypothetical protein
MKPIKIYWHINELTCWRHRLDQQWNLIKNSGLYDASQNVFLCGNGQPWTFLEWMNNQPETKLNFLKVHTSASYWEYPTLNQMHEHAAATEDDYNILYIHLKGVTRPDQPNVEDWCKFLQWSVIERWQDCVDKLEEGYDCVGPNWDLEPWPHFSGNFWWSHADYIRRLPVPQHPETSIRTGRTQFKTHQVDPPVWRFDYEAWIGSAQPRHYEISRSLKEGGAHYWTPYPESNYRK